MSKYFTICNLDQSIYTYEHKIEDQKILKDLKYSFLDKKDFESFVRPGQLIADVEVDENKIEYKKFSNIDSRILYANGISLTNYRIYKPILDNTLEDISKLDKNTDIIPPNEQFNVILTTLNIYGKLFESAEFNGDLYIMFVPEKYFNDEVICLQNKLSECLKFKDETKTTIASINYNEKSLNLEQNVRKALLKMFRLLSDFNLSTHFVLTLHLSSTNIIRSNTTDYQRYLNILSIFAGYLLDNSDIDSWK